MWVKRGRRKIEWGERGRRVNSLGDYHEGGRKCGKKEVWEEGEEGGRKCVGKERKEREKVEEERVGREDGKINIEKERRDGKRG